MANMVEFHFKGETFRVSEPLGYAQKVDACIQLLKAREDRRRGEKAETYFEVDRMPEGATSETPRKRGRPAKVVSATPTGEMPAEGHTEPVESTLYTQGFYRVPCATCGEGIPLTGKRGRAPKYHADCRPTENVK